MHEFVRSNDELSHLECVDKAIEPSWQVSHRDLGLLTGICFSAPPAHESPVGVGWWGFNRNLLFRPARPRVTGRRGMVGVQGEEGSFPIHLGVI